MLTTDEAYQAMLEFLAAYWRRGGATSSDIGLLLTMAHRVEEGDTADPAQWQDWLDAVAKIKSMSDQGR